MIVVISSNEREKVKQAISNSGIELIEQTLPFDILLYTNRGTLGIERKVFPSDFISSVKDGRLARECAALREETKFHIVIKEGRGKYSRDSKLKIGHRETEWNKIGIRNLIRSIRYVEGCDVEETDNLQGTVETIQELQKYFDTKNHLSIRDRPSIETDWFKPTYQERFLYWLQGCGKGISAVRAKAISQVYKTPIEVYNATLDDIMSIKGLGKKTATSLYNFLRGLDRGI